MGGTNTFTFKEPEGKYQDFTYQFIVDFSQVSKELRLSEGDLNLDLVLTPYTTSQAPQVPKKDEETHQITIGLKEAATFILGTTEPTTDNTNEAVVTMKYAASDGNASIWNNRNMALVFTAPDNVPNDLYMEIKMGNRNTVCYMNAQKQFIVSLEQFSLQLSNSWENKLQVTLNSKLLPEEVTDYKFTVKWFVADSQKSVSPLNGYKAASTDITFKCKNDVSPSAKIEDGTRLLKIGEDIETTIKYMDVPEGASIQTKIYHKNDDGDYVNTLIDDDVEGTLDNSSGIYTYSYKRSITNVLSGSYRLNVIVTKDNKQLLSVPYYFILLNSDGTYGSK
jgi:hypothetical protein